MVDIVGKLPVRLTGYFDVEKSDGRILRYWIDPDPHCPNCWSQGCKDKVENGKINDWIRICPMCNCEFTLIEEIPKGTT